MMTVLEFHHADLAPCNQVERENARRMNWQTLISLFSPKPLFKLLLTGRKNMSKQR